MTDEQAFLAAIFDHPDEDTPRLAYADWLEEHADALPGRDPQEVHSRAAYIRLQIEAVRLPFGPRRVAVENRIQALPDHLELWREPYRRAYGGHVPPLMGFRRGFIDRFEGSPADAGRFPAVAAVCPIQELAIDATRDGGQTDLAAVHACPALARVRRIEFTRFPEDVARPVLSSPHLTGLRSLRMRWGWLEGAVELVAASPAGTALQELWVWDSGTGGVTPGRGLGTLVGADWPALRAVRIDNFAVGNEGARLLAAEFAARGRRQLHVSGQALTAAGLRPAVEAALPGGLDSLSLAYSTALGEAPRELPPGARELRLEGFFNDGDALADWLVGAVPPGRFDRLGLVRCRVGRAGARALAGWPGLTHLKELDLSNNWFGDAGAKDLANSPNLGGLEALYVAHNDITKTGKDALKGRFGRRARIS